MAEVSSGIARSKKGGSPGSETAYFEFRWNSVPNGIGKTKVNWELWRCGRYSHPKRFRHGYEIKIYVNGSVKKTLKKEDYFVDDDTHTFDDNKDAARAASESFIVEHKTDGSASLEIEFTNIYIYSTSNIGGNREVFSLTKNYPITKCGAPTSVKINESRVAPGGKFTISWSGAIAGTANAITGYRVEYKVGNGNWAVAATKNTTTSKVVTLPANSVRGANIIAQVKTLGTQSGYDSGFKASSGDHKVNTLPNKPTVTVNKKIFTSQETTQLTINATAGSDGDTNQTLKIQYRVRSKADVDSGKSGSITEYTEPIFKTPESGQYLYEFWTDDGLEYSTSEQFWTIKNPSRPTVTIKKISGTALVSVNNESGKDYIINPTVTWSKGSNGWTNNSYRIGIRYSTDPNFQSYTNVLVSGKTITNLTYTIPDVRTYIPISTDTGYYYKIYVERYDGIEWGLGLTTTAYYVTKIPTINHVLNDGWGHSSQQGLGNFFSKQLYFYYPYDQGYNQIEFVAKDSDGNQKVGPINLIPWNDDNKNELLLGRATESDLQAWGRGQEYNIFLKPKYIKSNTSYIPASYQTKELKDLEDSTERINITRTRTLALPTAKQLNFSWSDVVRPFVADKQKITFLKLIGSENENETWYHRYGFSSIPTFSITASNNSYTETISGLQYSYNGTSGEITITGQQIYDLFTNIGLNTLKTTNYSIRVDITSQNFFGENLTGQITKQLNFNEDFKITPTEVYVGSGNKATGVIYTFKGDNNASEIDFLKEGNPISIVASVKSFHGKPNGLRVQFLSEENEVIAEGAKGSNLFEATANSVGHQAPVEYQTTYTVNSDRDMLFKVNTIEKDTRVAKINIIVADARGLKKTKTYDIPSNRNIVFKRHTSANLSVSEEQYVLIGTEPWIKGEVKISDFGFSPPSKATSWKCSLYLYNEHITAGKKEIKAVSGTNNTLPSIQEFEAKLDSEIGQFSTSYLELVTEYEINGSKTTYTTRSENFVVYNTIPTMCYRTNSIGINCDPTADSNNGAILAASLVVGAHSGKDKVVFKSANNQIVLDLNSGKITSMVIDCGSWNPKEEN